MDDLQQRMNKLTRQGFIILISTVALLACIFQVATPKPRQPTRSIPLSQLLADAQQGLIARIEIQQNPRELYVTYRNPPDELVFAQLAEGQEITTLLAGANVKLDSLVIQAAPLSAWNNLGGALLYCLPTLLILAGAIVLIIIARRKAQRLQQ